MKTNVDGEIRKDKILYVASTESHLKRFHFPYIQALKEEYDVYLMGNGKELDFCIPFSKTMFSPKNLLCLLKIRKILKKQRFDKVILNTALAAFLVRLAMFGIKKRPYVVNIVHGYLFYENKKGKKDKFLLFCEKMLRKKTDRIVVMNQEDFRIANRYRLCLGEILMSHGMGYQIPSAETERNEALRQEIGVATDEILLGFVGELSHRKNQIFLLRALENLRKQGAKAKLLLVGSGSCKEELLQEIHQLGIETDVILPGNQEPIFPWLTGMDLYVSASKIEGLPFNIMEAMALGLPIVASDIKGQSDLLDVQDLYPLDNMDAFCNMVQEKMKNPMGVGTQTYQKLQAYRLAEVFQENLQWMKGE